MKRFICLLIIMLCFISVAFASIVVLETGQTIDGEITERNDDHIKINYEGIEVTFYLDEISTIDNVAVEVPEAEDYSETDSQAYAEIEPEQEDYSAFVDAPVQDNLVEQVDSGSYFSGEKSGQVSQALSSSSRASTDNVFGAQQGFGAQKTMSLSEKLAQRGMGQGEIPRAALGAVLAPFMIVMMFLLLILAANWRIYSKAGYPGWASIVPIYNIYILVKIAGKPVWWMLLMFIPIVSIVIFIVINIGIAQNFGKGIGYGLGLTFLPLIFVPLLGFGNAQYISNQKVGNPLADIAV